VIKNGSRAYVDKLVAGFKDRILLNTPVREVKRLPSHIEITTDNVKAEKFDYVFFASHSDQALSLIDHPEPLERRILSAFPYQDNEVILHTDTRLLPARKLAWASWNYHRTAELRKPVSVTYNMNILQGLQSKHTFCVTLNNTQAIDESKILRRINYAHPLFTPEGIQAQIRHSELNGQNRCFYAGAYWRYGFHEDGVVSALQALKDFEEQATHEQQALRWAS
jgi:predicted NAD/FAD-binding protein